MRDALLCSSKVPDSHKADSSSANVGDILRCGYEGRQNLRLFLSRLLNMRVAVSQTQWAGCGGVPERNSSQTLGFSFFP